MLPWLPSPLGRGGIVRALLRAPRSLLRRLSTWVPTASARAIRWPACLAAAFVVGLALGSASFPPTSRAEAQAQAADPRFFAETGFRVDRDSFWDYFQKRGGLRTFGYPVSRDFLFRGCTTQFFQRLALQQCGSNGVGLLNLLDAGLLPYTRINGSTFPAGDPGLASQAPLPGDPDYTAKALAFVETNVPDTFAGEPVNFLSTFQGTVSAAEAFPDGEGNPGLLFLVNLELWGLPTSAPQRDPSNFNFIYQRFQRGIMHYDKTTGLTQGLLLADYLKAVVTGKDLPPDLEAQARGSALYRSALDGSLPTGTVYGNAFDPSGSTIAGTPASQPVSRPVQSAAASTPVPAQSTSTPAPSPDYGLSMFLWSNPATTDRDLKLATSAGFRWQKTLFQWRMIEGEGKGRFNWAEADRIVKASGAAGVKVLARLDFQPQWARRDGANNGPPDNYQDYWDFVSAFVSRYRAGSPFGQVQAIEVWNEVNLDREWGNQAINQQQAADYVRFLSGAYRAAKAADPSVTVITAGLSPTGVTNGKSADDLTYLQWLYGAGLKGGVNYDVLGAHGNTQAPEVDVPLNSLPAFGHPSFYFRRIEQLRDVMVKAGDADRQIWLLEFGWTSDQVHPAYSWFAISEEKKAQNIVKAFQYARQNWSPWIGVMTLWTFVDPAWTPEREEYWWAINNPDGSARPAYNAVKAGRQNGSLP